MEIPGYLRDPVELREVKGRKIPCLVVALEHCNAATSLRAIETLRGLGKTCSEEDLLRVEREVHSSLPLVIENNRRADMMGEGVWKLVWIFFRLLRTDPSLYASLPEEWLQPPDGLLHEDDVFFRLAPAHVHALCRIYLTNEDLHPRVKSLLFTWLDTNPFLDVRDTFDHVAKVLHMTNYDYKRFHNTHSPVLKRYMAAMSA